MLQRIHQAIRDLLQKSRRRSFRHSSPWLESMARTANLHRRKGVRFGGIYDSAKNSRIFHQYNYKILHLPYQVIIQNAVDVVMNVVCSQKMLISHVV